MGIEEGDDAVPCVLGGGLVVADSCDAHDPEQKVAVVVEERVPGVGILLDVVLDSVCCQRPLQPVAAPRWVRSLAP